MVSIPSLWLPILISAVVVFIVSAIIHMVLPLHRSDYRKVPAEDEVMDALRKFNIPPGDYMLPCGGGPAAMKDPEFLAKMEKGPVAIVTFVKAGQVSMGGSLALWFVYSILVGVIAAYVSGRALAAGSDYLAVFRFAGCVAFVGYSMALMQNSIWSKRSWVTTIKLMLDGLLYGLLTGGVFGWLWPR